MTEEEKHRRDFFAVAAMRQMIDHSEQKSAREWLDEEFRVARWAVRYADALIKELDKPTTEQQVDEITKKF